MVGIRVALETENGIELDSVGDPTYLLNKILPELGDRRFHWANTIDCYGETVFNRLQAPLLREEWALLIADAKDDETRSLLRRVDELLMRCADELHHYVRFSGD